MGCARADRIEVTESESRLALVSAAAAEGVEEPPAFTYRAEADPRRLEATEERLFALRAAARKHSRSSV